MGAAAQKRGDAVIARQAARIYTGEQVAGITRDLDHDVLRLTNEAKAQATELETLRAQLAERDALRAQMAQLETHLDQATKRAHHNAELWRAELRERQRIADEHNKLSRIVRLALTSEEYERFRDIEEMHDDKRISWAEQA